MANRCSTRKVYPTNLPPVNIELVPIYVPNGVEWPELRLTAAPADEKPGLSVHPKDLTGVVDIVVETPLGELAGTLDCDNYLGNGKAKHGDWWTHVKAQGPGAVSCALSIELLTAGSLGEWCDLMEDLLNFRWIETPHAGFKVERTHLSAAVEDTFGYQIPHVEEVRYPSWERFGDLSLLDRLGHDTKTMLHLLWELCGDTWTPKELEEHITVVLAAFGIAEHSDPHYWRPFFRMSFFMHPNARVRAVAAAQSDEMWWHTDPSPHVRVAAARTARADALRYVACDPDDDVREAVIANPDAPLALLAELGLTAYADLGEYSDDTLVAVAQRDDLPEALAWALAEDPNQAVQSALMDNPYCPRSVRESLEDAE